MINNTVIIINKIKTLQCLLMKEIWGRSFWLYQGHFHLSYLCFLIFFFLFLWLHLLLFFFFSFIDAIIIMASKVLLYSNSRIHFYFSMTNQLHFIVIFFRKISFLILFHGIQSYAKIDSWINGTNCCPRNRVTCDNIWSPCHCTTKNYTICIK